MKKLLFTLALLFLFLMSFSQTYSRVKIKLQPHTLQIMGSLGIPVEGEVDKERYLITELSADDLSEMASAGIQYEVLIHDMADYYVHRNVSGVPDQQYRNCGEPVYYPVPSNFSLGSMGGYFTLSEIYEDLDSMRARFPDLVSQRQAIGSFTTHQGRTMYYVKLSDNPDVAENEPKIYYQSLVHAREPMGMQQLFFYMWYLLENYNTNAEIQYLLDNSEMYFIPCANPDGYEYNRQTQPSGGGMWRKNRRNNGSSYGVDLNRNFGYMWGYDNIGSSPTAGDETYRGPSAFSEPETQAVKWLVETLEPVLLLDYHTYSDVLLYPFGYVNQKCPDSTIYDVYSSYLTSENKFAYGTPYQTIGYNANGGSFDWYYGEQTTKDKVIGWGPEAGNADDGFWPQQSRITSISMNYMAMNLYLARFALKYAEVNDNTDSWVNGSNQQFVFDITRLGMEENGVFTVTLHALSNITVTGSPKVFSGMNLLETLTDSVAYTVLPTVVPGDQLEMIVELNNGHYSHFDTIRKIYGEPVELMNDDCSSLTAWTGNWALTTADFVSSPSSITDSPSGDYSNNSSKSITTVNAVDLSDAVAARLSFWARWDIEAGWDYAQVMISSDNGVTWTPLCGKYSVNGTTYQDENEPVYDGIKYQWVKEEVNLSNWIGQQVKFRFRLVSDMYTVGDGFYFDDFLVEVIFPDTTITVDDISESRLINVFPNPADQQVLISAPGKQISQISVFGTDGIHIADYFPEQEVVILPLNQLNNGIYILKICTGSDYVVKKLNVLR